MAQDHRAQKRPPKPGFGAWLRNNFFAGIVVITPIAVTVGLIVFLISLVDDNVNRLAQWINKQFPAVPVEIYSDYTFFGLGVLVAFVAITILGILARNFFGRFLLNFGERIVDRLPFVRTVYRTIKQIVDTIFRDQSDFFKDVGLVEYPLRGSWALCFITAKAAGEVAKKLDGPHVCVFIPTTPNPTSGFLLYVPRENIKLLDLTVEEGAKLIISMGMVTEEMTEKGSSRPAVTVSNPDELERKPASDASPGAQQDTGPGAVEEVEKKP